MEYHIEKTAFTLAEGATHVALLDNYRKNAFTLAEVLITIGIIGVVAAMTMPVLLTKYKDNEHAVRCKRTYSLITQAISKYQADSGTVGDVTGLFDVTKTSAEVLNNFAKYFEVVKICNDYSGGCAKYRYNATYAYPLYNADNDAIGNNMTVPLMILKDGSIIRISQKSSCHRIESGNDYNPDGTVKVDSDGNPIIFEWESFYCATLTYDTNGIAKPNQFGADMFTLRINEDGTVVGAWGGEGKTSLNSILSGGGPIYTRYTSGDKKQ